MANRFFTVLVIPEKTSKVRRWVIPSWMVKGSVIALGFVAVLAFMMFLDYWYVMGQIDLNNDLKIENRRLRQEVQIFRNKMRTVENTMDRVKTFTTRLKVITNIEDRESLVQKLDQDLPNASENIGTSDLAETKDPKAQIDLTTFYESNESKNPENLRLRRQQEELEEMFADLNHNSLIVEQELQDLYELLVDQKSFLAALPTIKPAIGYFTSGFGIRKSPYGRRVKMHEGLDIANHIGTTIRATANGQIRYAGRKLGYGKTVIINHGYGLETWYGHTKRIFVRKGEKVERGQKIAAIGNTGRSTGPHVHYEVRVHGIPVDPLHYILED